MQKKVVIGISIFLVIVFLFVVYPLFKENFDSTDAQIQIKNLDSQEMISNEKSPIAQFTKEDIEKLEVDCSGTDEEIAECILDWQSDNMIYVPSADENEGPFLQSYEGRWQELIPGIFTSKDVLETHISKSGEPYGVCFEFAVVYCSIAEYYGLECRVSQSYVNINGEERAGGMSTSEYEAFKPWLTKAGLNYDYEAVRLTVPNDSEIAGHYWAEVRLENPSDFDNNEWRIMDASNKQFDGRQLTLEHINDGEEWEVVNWLLKDKTSTLNEYQARIDSGENIGQQNDEGYSDMDTFTEGRDIYADDVEAGREETYVGITDELGNENRAITIDDFMQGKGLAPYMVSCRDSCDYVMAGNPCKDDCEELDEEPAVCYKSCSGDDFFIVCDYICDDVSDSELPDCYKSCSGKSLDIDCGLECWDD